MTQQLQEEKLSQKGDCALAPVKFFAGKWEKAAKNYINSILIAQRIARNLSECIANALPVYGDVKIVLYIIVWMWH